MQCDDVAQLLPEAVEHGAAVELSVQRHIETLPALPGRARPLPPDAPRPPAAAHPLPRARARAARADPRRASRRRASARRVRSILSGRRLAYAGAIGGAAVAATAATATAHARAPLAASRGSRRQLTFCARRVRAATLGARAAHWGARRATRPGVAAIVAATR